MNKKIKIEIKNRWTGAVLFEYEKEDNTLKDTLEQAVKSRADLSEADLCGADLSGADLGGADLGRADLSGANLYRTNLTRANLEKANLIGAYLSNANLIGANLIGAYLSGAYLIANDYDIDEKETIENFEKSTNIKIKETYINHDIFPTRWNCFWKNGLIIRDWEVAEPKKEVKKMTVEEICNALGYDIEIVKERDEK